MLFDPLWDMDCDGYAVKPVEQAMSFIYQGSDVFVKFCIRFVNKLIDGRNKSRDRLLIQALDPFFESNQVHIYSPMR
jgi:hypothetical protein